MEDKKIMLYAEDDPSLRKLIQLYAPIAFPDYELQIHSDGTSLDKRLEQGPNGAEIVVTDNRMPGITGIDIIKKYARRENFKDTMFILVSSDDESIGKEALEYGARFKSKPCTSIDLRDFINNLK